jgi:hypothetical protein
MIKEGWKNRFELCRIQHNHLKCQQIKNKTGEGSCWGCKDNYWYIDLNEGKNLSV